MQSSDEQRQMLPIGAVVTMLQREYLEVTHSSLRFLEREGLIVPTRTDGGHRLFTASDIDRIRQIKDWQAHRLSLEEIRQRLEIMDSASPPSVLADQFLSHALAGDIFNARRTILEASELGLPLSMLFADVLRPALRELGQRWENGEVSVAQEKEVSEVVRDLIAELTLRHSGTGTDSGYGIVAACVVGEQHELGLRMLGGLLSARHIAVHYLGSSVDTDFLVDAVRLRRPRIVLLSATLDENVPSIRVAHDALRAAGITTRVVAGGQAVLLHADEVASWGVEVAGDDPVALVDMLSESVTT